jgi:poly(3-hydroxybutyrate) depolymerase
MGILTFSCAAKQPEKVIEPETPPVSLCNPQLQAPAGSALASKLQFTAAEASQYAQELSAAWKEAVKEQSAPQFHAKALHIGDKTMRIWWNTYGEKPADGRSLYISLHGGGGAPASLNDSQWDNQKRLYTPEEGVYLAPRAITNTWDLHFVPEADAFYEAIIRYAVSELDVNPNKVYIMGYSAGGDGVWRLGPRMADHWAAASMMAGHPGDVRLEGLRNTPFMIWCGGEDAAYNRNQECATRIKQMDALQ